MSGRDAASALLLLALLSATLLLARPSGEGGPLAACASAAAVHAALLAPAFGGRSFAAGLLPLPLALPALCASSYGHGARPLALSALVVALATLSGASARRAERTAARGLYLPSALLLFLAPFGLAYLVSEFGAGRDPEPWRLLSPVAALGQVGREGPLPAAPALLLLCWPVLSLALPARTEG
jgi:hypothetical protein